MFCYHYSFEMISFINMN
ncbi:hypothetical protein F383_24866 [Gossypium arboreum]|uniref:Uncharacterized protein n=1 Tax=Gossypium arboreum TaxID=29729 RepID=A0A0B0P5H0_GOSAR|nr:hypothetical protein F383_24866 [Gossypium arboreum]